MPAKIKSEKLSYLLPAVLSGLMLVVSLLFIGSIVTMYTALIAEDYQIERSMFSMYTFVKAFVGFFLNMSIVWIMRKLSMRRMILIGIVLAAVSLIVLATSHSFIWIVVSAVLSGIGASFCGTVPVAIIIRNWYRSNYGTVLVWVMSASGIGGFIFNPIVSKIAVSSGWRNAFLILSLISVVVFVSVLLLLRTDPAEIGMSAYGREEKSKTNTNKKTAKRVELHFWGSDHNSRNYRILFLMSALFASGCLCLYTNIPSVLQDIGFSVSFATGIAASILSIMNCIGKIVMGKVNDKFGSSVFLIIWYVCAFIASIYFLFYRGLSSGIALVGVILIGISGGIYSVPIPVITEKLFANKENYTFVISRCTAGTSILSAFSGLLFHGCYDLTQSYVLSLILNGVFTGICMMLGNVKKSVVV